jgi:cell division protein YceG involved in septum cleavage
VIKERGIDKRIQAGSYRLSASMNAYNLAEALTHGTNDTYTPLFCSDEISKEI